MTDENLMMAVLAMHAYADPFSATTDVGKAEFIEDAPQALGFAAYAYSYNGQTVISFRGTLAARQ